MVADGSLQRMKYLVACRTGIICDCRIAVILVAVAVPMAAPAVAARSPAWTPDSYVLGYFHDPEGVREGLDHLALSVEYELPELSSWLSVSRLSLRLQASLGMLQHHEGSGLIATLGPVLQWDVMPGSGGAFVELGVTPTYLSQSRFGSSQFGGAFAFTLHLVAGWRPAHEGPFFGVGVQHISNADLYNTQPHGGGNLVGLVMGWQLP